MCRLPARETLAVFARTFAISFLVYFVVFFAFSSWRAHAIGATAPAASHRAKFFKLWVVWFVCFFFAFLGVSCVLSCAPPPPPPPPSFRSLAKFLARAA